MKYFDTTNENGSHGKYLCESCAATACVEGKGYDVIEHRHNLDRDLEEQTVGTWCDSCNAPLDTPFDDYQRKIRRVVFATTYSSAPLAFRPVNRKELSEIAAQIADPNNDKNATTEWSRSALECDRKGVEWAQEQKRPLVAQDEDGWYFAAIEA